MHKHTDLFPLIFTANNSPPEFSQSLPELAGNGLKFRPFSYPLAGLKYETDDDHDRCSPSLPCYYHRSFSSSFSLEQLRALQSPKQNDFNPIFNSFQGKQEFWDSQGSSLRRVYSTGDLQRINHLQLGSPLIHENSSVDGLVKVGRYSAEERKERIERYRSKRNQRNFNKKIKYACRKTLADSRPRVRGRFVRNEESGENSQSEWNRNYDEDDEEDCEAWANFLDIFSMN